MYFNQKAINNVDSFARVIDGFNFKIKRDSFGDRW